MKKTLLAFLTIPVLFALGTYAYLWYATAKRADGLVASLAPFAHADYGSIFVSPFGSATVSGISITPHGSYTRIELESVSVQAPSIFVLAGVGKRARTLENLPEYGSVSFRGLSVPLHSKFLAPLKAMNEAREDVSYEALACGDIKAIGPQELIDMGVERLRVDGSAGYRYNHLTERAEMELNFGLRELTDMRWVLDVPMANVPDNLMNNGRDFDMKLATVTMDFEDRGFNVRRNRFCAQRQSGEEGADPLAWAETHVDALVRELSYLGLSPEPAMVEAYRRFSAESGSFGVVIEPFGKLTLGDMQTDLNRLARLAASSSIRVTHNGRPIEGELRQVSALPRPRAPVAEALTGGDDLAERAVMAALSRERPRIEYLPVSAADVPRHLNRTALITTREGRRYKGRLEALRDRSLGLRLRMSGGSATYWFDLEDLSEIRVETRRF